MATAAILILVGSVISAWLLWTVSRWYVGVLIQLGAVSMPVRIVGGVLLWLLFGAVCLIPLYLASVCPPVRSATDESALMTLWLVACYLGAFVPAGHHIFVRRIGELRAAGFYLPEA